MLGKLSALLYRQAGQAMVEYSFISVLLLCGSIVVATAPFGPGHESITTMFLKAYTRYQNSFFFMFNTPFP